MFGFSAFSEAPFSALADTNVDVLVELVGVPSAAVVNGVTVTGDANFDVIGSASVSAVGTVTVGEGSGVDVPVTGLPSIGAVGTVTIDAGTGVVVNLIGVASPVEVKPVLVWGRIVPEPGTVYTEITPGGSAVWEEIAA